MIWSNGFSARYEISIVDPASWRDISFLDMTGGSIDKTTDNLMESADIDMRKIPGDGEVWIRIWLDARQEGSEPMHVPLFTGLTTAPERSINGSRESYSVECFSVLKPASDILMQRGWYAPEGIDGAALASSLLKSGPAPVAYEENSPLLSQSIIAEDNETNLSMAEKIISAIGWRIRVSGDGRIGIMTKASEASAVFDATRNDSLQMQVTDTSDWYSCPNIFRAVMDDSIAVARDEDPESRFSVSARGREIWMEETDCDLNSGETLADYAKRRLKEEQSPGRKISYDRRFDPSVTAGDIVRIHYPDNMIDGLFRISTQSINLGFGAKVTEEVTAV